MQVIEARNICNDQNCVQKDYKKSQARKFITVLGKRMQNYFIVFIIIVKEKKMKKKAVSKPQKWKRDLKRSLTNFLDLYNLPGTVSQCDFGYLDISVYLHINWYIHISMYDHSMFCKLITARSIKCILLGIVDTKKSKNWGLELGEL